MSLGSKAGKHSAASANTPHFGRRIAICAVLACACAAFGVMGVNIASAYNSSKVDVSWYVGHESDATYSIDTPGKLAGFAQLVNGTYKGADGNQVALAAIDFSGKTIYITRDIQGLPTWISAQNAGAQEPIGTASHPFNGTVTGWDGDASSATDRKVKFNLTVSGNKTSSDIGLFGYVGPSGSVQYLSATSDSTVTVTLSGTNTVARGIGSLVGTCMGSMGHCNSAANVSITNNTTLGKTAPVAIRNAGGLVGACRGNLTNCTYSGTLSVKSSSATYVADSLSYPVAANLGGLVGLYGDESNKHTHGTLTSSTNGGTLDLALTGSAVWSERFSEWIFPDAEAVGGIAGYSYGSIESSTNSGAIKAGKKVNTNLNPDRVTYTGGDCTGGIVGSLRGAVTNGSSATSDDGTSEDKIVIDCCANTATIDGYYAVGGIAGVAGTYTTITGSNNSGKVNSYRWNKPAGAGIAGQTYGNVSYCYNTGEIVNVPGAGYYCAGIAGMVFRFWDKNMNPTSPEPNIYACYNAGTISVTSGSGNWKQGGIVGQNDGYVHDNVLLRGTCYDNRFGSSSGEDYGSFGTNTLVTAEELKSNTSLLALNAMCDNEGWTKYYTLVDAVSKNAGRPILNTQASGLGTNDLSTGTVDAICTKNAQYTGLESVPTVSVKFNNTNLTQNIDYKVVPQNGATAYTGNERPYQATIVGIGAYTGTASSTVAYGISKGDLSACTVSVASKKYNWENQPPTKDMIMVYDPAGHVVDPANWQFSAQGDSNGKFINYKNGGYEVTVTPAQGSNLFTGSVKGSYSISKADIREDCTTHGITYKGEVFYWDDTANDWLYGKRPQFTYTGSSILPEVLGVSYANKNLLLGRDYKVVYGNPNSDTNADSAANANTEVTRADGGNRGCVTTRFVTYSPYGVYNFVNFTNMLFDIVPAGKLPSFIAYEQAYTGKEVKPFTGSYMGLREGTDYTVSYSNNTAVGTAKYTITGKGAYAGNTQTGDFKILEAKDMPDREGPVKVDVNVTASAITYGQTLADSKLTGTMNPSAAGTFAWVDSSITPSVADSNKTSYDVVFTPKDTSKYKIAYATATLTVNPHDLSNANVTFEKTTYAYTGSAINPDVVVKLDGKTLKNGEDYTIDYGSGEKVESGNYPFTVTFKGNYKGSKTGNLTIFEKKVGTQAMHRLYNPNSGEHFYTSDDAERDNLVSLGWNDEGTGWTAPETSSTPVYRLYNSIGGEHHYTFDASEKDFLVSVGWNDEGIGWYSDDAKTVPLYREYNPNAYSNNHNYTTDPSEHEFLCSIGWNDEGFAWYGVE